MWKRQTVTQLAGIEDRSVRWVKIQLAQAHPNQDPLIPQSTPIAADVTFWGRHYGVCIFRSPTLKRNLWWKEVTEETPFVYGEGLHALRKQGWNITGAILDGKQGVAKVFSGMPVQICQFHQVKTITKYLTQKPKTQASWELKWIALQLKKSNEKEFTKLLHDWRIRWDTFLSERTPCSHCKPNYWPFTHRKLRAAYRSLNMHLPMLFTYQKYPEL